MLKFRLASMQDIPSMSSIRLSVTENALSNPGRITRQMYEEYLELLGRGWVCELDGKVVGFSYAEKADSSIWALFVAPQHEGKGIGKGLLNLAVEWLFDHGANEVKLSTAANTRADHFYAAQGWLRLGMKNDIDVGYSLKRPDYPVV